MRQESWCTKMETKTNVASDELHSSNHSKLSPEEIAKAVARHVLWLTPTLSSTTITARMKAQPIVRIYPMRPLSARTSSFLVQAPAAPRFPAATRTGNIWH
jgi:hypothetical protein